MINIIFFSFIKTGKHSSRTRTVCCSGRRGGGWCLPAGGGGGVCPSACWDTCPGDVCPVHAGISARGECLPQCMLGYLPGGSVCPSACGDTPPPWTEFLTHAYENIALPQLLLRTVIMVNAALRIRLQLNY